MAEEPPCSKSVVEKDICCAKSVASDPNTLEVLQTLIFREDVFSRLLHSAKRSNISSHIRTPAGLHRTVGNTTNTAAIFKLHDETKNKNPHTPGFTRCLRP